MSDLIAKIQAAQREAGERAVIAHLEQMGLTQPAPITSESGNQAAQGASAITSESAQAVALLTDEQIKAKALEAFSCQWDADDETLVNKYGHGVYLWRFVDFARAIESLVRSKLGAGVPMTPAELDKAMQAMFYPARNRAFMDGVRAAERHHGIVGKEGGNV